MPQPKSETGIYREGREVHEGQKLRASIAKFFVALVYSFENTRMDLWNENLEYAKDPQRSVIPVLRRRWINSSGYPG